MKRYIGEMIWFALLGSLLVLFMFLLGGCCYASTESVPGEKRVLSPEVPFRSGQDKGA